MEISKERKDNGLIVKVIGRLDATTAPELEAFLHEELEGVKKLTLDFEKLEYISSAGLRVLLAAQKKMNEQGSMLLTGVRDVVMEVLELTNFSSILEIEQ